MSGQGNLLNYCDQLSCNVDAVVKMAMRQSAKDSPLSREQICDRMNEVAEAAGFRLGSVEPLRAMARPLGAHIIDKRQALLLKRAEVDEEIRSLQRLKKKIEGDL